jgi:3-deoxy-D-manno-octulosonic-acid transferase
MRGMRLIYSALLFLLVPLVLLRLAWRARRQPEYLRNVGERFGRYTGTVEYPVLWVHAVSVGEVRAAEPLVRALQSDYPSHRILLTHMTPTGRQTGEQLFGDTVLRCYLPYDLPFAVARFLQHYRPLVGVLIETELWPNLIHASRSAGVRVLLVNARLSARSARGYARLGGLTRETLQGLAGAGAQSEADAERLRALGAAPVTVTGNLKFDRGPKPADLELAAKLRDRFGARPVLVAASTRAGEEERVLDAIGGMPPELLTVIVPRHPQRFQDVAQILERRGTAYQRRSENAAVRAGTRVLLGDSMGELFAYYAACDIAFVGGSLLPLGGQNLLEACAIGKPVLIGPHTFNFAQATQLAVEAGAAVQVADVAQLTARLRELLGDAQRRERMGKAGLVLMRQHEGATRRTLELVRGVLDSDKVLSTVTPAPRPPSERATSDRSPTR